MKANMDQFPWLDLVDHPTFCVKDNIVIAANSAAKKHYIHPGTDIYEIVTQNRDVYKSFKNGSLYLTITICDMQFNACVTRIKECDVFTIIQSEEDIKLQALALAAQQLRAPLSNTMTIADRLFSIIKSEIEESPKEIGQINKHLYQMLHIITNMSDASNYKDLSPDKKQTVNFTALFDEIIEKVQSTAEATGKKITYNGLNSIVLGLANEERLARAIYNMISNALKHSPAGSILDAKVSRNCDMLSFTISNKNVESINDFTIGSNYNRPPTIEDRATGLGLGMTLITAVANSHGGTVLVDHPNSDITRVTMTIAITKSDSDVVRSPIFKLGDYAGGYDKALVELSEILPAEIYDRIDK